jgi:integrase
VMVRKTRRLLGSLIADAQERGLVAQNVVRARCRCRRWSSPHCASIASLAPTTRLASPFRTVKAGLISRTSIVERGLHPAQVAAGVVNCDGEAKYPGLHSLRHFYASWCINRRVDGGLELPLKVVQARLGHASIQMTADTYGHLFPRGDDGAELAAAERAFFG